MGLQAVLHLLYPPQCLNCDALVTTDFGLCGHCWRETPFISGTVCDRCGTPLPGQDTGKPEYCDDCLTIARPWLRGRAALLYRDNGRNLTLALKHGDRMSRVGQRPGFPRALLAGQVRVRSTRSASCRRSLGQPVARLPTSAHAECR